MKHRLISLFIFALTSIASAQSTAFTYQGHLMDAGASANGNYVERSCPTDYYLKLRFPRCP